MYTLDVIENQRILSKLGSTLLKANKNDIEFSYSMMLVSDEGYLFDNKTELNNSKAFYKGVLEVGNYIFVRKEDRTEDIDWKNICMDDLNGRIVLKEDNEKCSSMDNKDDYRENTYLTIQIDKGMNATDLDLQENSYGSFIEQMKKEAKADATLFGEITSKLNKNLVRTVEFNDARKIVDDMKVGRKVNREKFERFVLKLKDTIEVRTSKVKPQDKILHFTEEQTDFLMEGLRKTYKTFEAKNNIANKKSALITTEMINNNTLQLSSLLSSDFEGLFN